MLKKGNRHSPLTLIVVIICTCVFFLSGCTSKSSSESNDILSQKPTDEARTQISVLVKYAFTINEFERIVEEKFPDIDIVQVGNYTHSMGKDEYAARLEHDDLTDIVMTWPLEVGSEYWEDRLIDLSGMNFTSKYNLSMLETISDNGKLYYLPGPAQVRGIIYNKTLFKEKGWEVPSDFEGFVALCKEIEADGIRSIQLPFKNAETLDTAFIGYGYADCFSKPRDVQWIENYNNGTGESAEHFYPAFNTFERMMNEGIWEKSDLNISYSQREKMLFTRKCAMVEDAVLLTSMGYDMTGTTDEFALMPFFNPNGEDNDWARIYMVCYIGLNKHLTEPQNKEKYQLVLKLMDYISTPEGQAALEADTGGMFSSLRGVPPSDAPEIADLVNALQHGRYAVFLESKNVQAALREGLAGMLKGTHTKEDVMAMMDVANTAEKVSEKKAVIGIADSDFTLIETGNFITDAMREKAESDVALYLDNGKDGRYNGKGLSAKIYKGDITQSDINRMMPDMKSGEEGVLCKVTMTGADLIKTIEYCMAVDNNQTGWFYYFSGLRMEFDPTAELGSRIKDIKLVDGSEIDEEKDYIIAVMDESVPKELLKGHKKTNILISDIIKDKIAALKTITPPNDGRFIIAK